MGAAGARCARVRDLMDEIEDYWERGAGRVAPDVRAINHALAMYGWNLRDARSPTRASSLAAAIKPPKDDLLDQLVENCEPARGAARLSALRRRDAGDDAARRGAGAGRRRRHRDPDRLPRRQQRARHGDRPQGRLERRRLRPAQAPTRVAPGGLRAPSWPCCAPRSSASAARHVIWATVPHVTVAPIARGVGGKVAPGLALLPVLHAPVDRRRRLRPATRTRTSPPPRRAPSTTRSTLYNEAITDTVARRPRRRPRLVPVRRRGRARPAGPAGATSRTRARARRGGRRTRSRRSWPRCARSPDSRFLTGDGHGGRATGGLFSLDGVHPTTVAYGLIARELIDIMRLAGVQVR